MGDADCSATDKILKVNYLANSIVINTQTPNRQLWYSSTSSGPQRFDYDPEEEAWKNNLGKKIEDILRMDLQKFV